MLIGFAFSSTGTVDNIAVAIRLAIQIRVRRIDTLAIHRMGRANGRRWRLRGIITKLLLLGLGLMRRIFLMSIRSCRLNGLTHVRLMNLRWILAGEGDTQIATMKIIVAKQNNNNERCRQHTKKEGERTFAISSDIQMALDV